MRRGLIVIVLPLLLEVVFLSVLAYLLIQAETEASQRIESKNIVCQATKLVAKLVDAQFIAIAYNAYPTPLLDVRFDEDGRSIRDLLLSLKSLCNGSEKRSKLASEVEASTEENLDRFGKMFTTEFDVNTEFKPFISSEERTDKTYKRFTGAVNKIDELLSLEQKTQAAVQAREKYYRNWLRQTIIWGLLANVLISMFLAVYFARRITNRLKIVLENTDRLVSRQELLPPLGGRDELAQLDDVFHATAKDLAYVDRHRKHLVALVKDDLSAPLREVQYALHNLAQGVLGDVTPKAEARLELAIADTDRVMRLIDDLLSIKTMEGAKFDLDVEKTSTSELIETALRSVRDMADQRGVDLQLKDAKIELIADKDRLVQVIINLLSNGIKFSKRNDMITIETSLEDEDWVRFAVIDQGRGIPEESLSIIFEPFKQVEESDQVARGGTGLGLPISKTIVEQHGGTIGVTSRIGEGSTFWFLIPIGNGKD